jgi:hypothetical protein
MKLVFHDAHHHFFLSYPVGTRRVSKYFFVWKRATICTPCKALTDLRPLLALCHKALILAKPQLPYTIYSTGMRILGWGSCIVILESQNSEISYLGRMFGTSLPKFYLFCEVRQFQIYYSRISNIWGTNMQSMPFLAYFVKITQWLGQLLIPQKIQQIW